VEQRPLVLRDHGEGQRPSPHPPRPSDPRIHPSLIISRAISLPFKRRPTRSPAPGPTTPAPAADTRPTRHSSDTVPANSAQPLPAAAPAPRPFPPHNTDGVAYPPNGRSPHPLVVAGLPSGGLAARSVVCIVAGRAARSRHGRQKRHGRTARPSPLRPPQSAARRGRSWPGGTPRPSPRSAAAFAGSPH
jgi:hypothetical protein